VSGSQAQGASPGRWGLRGIRVFSSVVDAPRSRRPTDVMMLVLSASSGRSTVVRGGEKTATPSEVGGALAT